MNIQHLKYIVEVEKVGSITKAASNLFMGQPNLSKAIKENRITHEEGKEFISNYRAGLYGYTYLE